MSKQLKLKAAELLERGGLVIATGDWWTQGDMARNEDGFTYESDRKASCFCAVGSLRAQGGTTLVQVTAESSLFEIVGNITRFNDTPGRTHTEVAHAMLMAAENLRKEAGEV